MDQKLRLTWDITGRVQNFDLTLSLRDYLFNSASPHPSSTSPEWDNLWGPLWTDLSSPGGPLDEA